MACNRPPVIRQGNAKSQHIPVDVRLVRVIGQLLRVPLVLVFRPEEWYVKVRSFVDTVCGGFVSDEMLSFRRTACATSQVIHHLRMLQGAGPPMGIGEKCQALYRDQHGIERCGQEDRLCKCPKHRWWLLSQLWFKRRCRRWQCPLGRFPRERSWVDVVLDRIARKSHRVSHGATNDHTIV